MLVKGVRVQRCPVWKRSAYAPGGLGTLYCTCGLANRVHMLLAAGMCPLLLIAWAYHGAANTEF